MGVADTFIVIVYKWADDLHPFWQSKCKYSNRDRAGGGAGGARPPHFSWKNNINLVKYKSGRLKLADLAGKRPILTE